jgi:hypothetical protein
MTAEISVNTDLMAKRILRLERALHEIIEGPSPNDLYLYASEVKLGWVPMRVTQWYENKAHEALDIV